MIKTGAVSSGFEPINNRDVSTGFAPTKVEVRRSDEKPLAMMTGGRGRQTEVLRGCRNDGEPKRRNDKAGVTQSWKKKMRMLVDGQWKKDKFVCQTQGPLTSKFFSSVTEATPK
jgi:hypothetical protein